MNPVKQIKFFLLLLILHGCAGIPRVHISELALPTNGKVDMPDTPPDSGAISELINRMAGARFGDPIFNKNSTAIWMIPEIYKLDLDKTAVSSNFSPEEYQRRYAKLVELHEQYLVFFLDLKMPLNPDITKDQLIEFLKQNLIITLENGTTQKYKPERIIFRSLPRFEQKEIQELLKGARKIEVSTPMRILFRKSEDGNPIISSKTKKLVIKLQLKSPPPFKIGYFDERLFMGFMWKIDRSKLK